MLMPCKCHITDLEVTHINERQKHRNQPQKCTILDRRGWGEGGGGTFKCYWRSMDSTSVEMLPGLWATSAAAVARGCTDAWGRPCLSTCTYSYICTYRHCPPSHTHTHRKTLSWLWYGGGWLMRACVHYYNIVSVEVCSADRILGQMKCVVDFFHRLTVTASSSKVLFARLTIHRLTKKDLCGACSAHSVWNTKSTPGVNCRAAWRIAALQHVRKPRGPSPSPAHVSVPAEMSSCH